MDASKKYLQGILAQLQNAIPDLLAKKFDWLDLTSTERFEEFIFAAAARKDATAILKNNLLKNPTQRYNLDYFTAPEIMAMYDSKDIAFDGSHYWYYSPVLSPIVLNHIFSKLSLFTQKEIKDCMIMDVGCGSGQLIRKLLEIGATEKNLYAVDIADTALDRVAEIHVAAYKGPLQNLHWEKESLDVAFLSYFIDRDKDQRASLETAARLVKPGGMLVIEGLFPCVMCDTNSIEYGQANVTKGNSVIEDIQEVWSVLEGCGFAGQSEIHIGQRLVYSLDGPEILPTFILVLNKPF